MARRKPRRRGGLPAALAGAPVPPPLPLADVAVQLRQTVRHSDANAIITSAFP